MIYLILFLITFLMRRYKACSMDFWVNNKVVWQLLTLWIEKKQCKANKKDKKQTDNNKKSKTNQNIEIQTKWKQCELLRLNVKKFPYPGRNLINNAQMGHWEFGYTGRGWLSIYSYRQPSLLRQRVHLLTRSKAILLLQASCFMSNVEQFYRCPAVHSYFSL